MRCVTLTVSTVVPFIAMALEETHGVFCTISAVLACHTTTPNGHCNAIGLVVLLVIEYEYNVFRDMAVNVRNLTDPLIRRTL